MDYAATGRKLDDLPSDGGRTVDTLAGAILRIFVRLNEIDATLGRFERRIAALESGVRPPPQARPQPPLAQSLPLAKAGAGAQPEPEDRADAAAGSRRGRPPGSRDTYPRQRRANGGVHDDDDDGDGLDPAP